MSRRQTAFQIRLCPPLVQRQPEENEDEGLQPKSKPGETLAVTPSLESRINILKGGSQPLSRLKRALTSFTQIQRSTLSDSVRAAHVADSSIETSTSSITGREGRQFANREGEHQPVPSAQVAARRLHPSVAGNVGASGNLDTAYWSGNSPPGYSLGGYASARGMSIFTVEPPLNCATADYAPGGSCAGLESAVSAAERRTELMSYAEARTVLLGSGASTP